MLHRNIYQAVIIYGLGIVLLVCPSTSGLDLGKGLGIGFLTSSIVLATQLEKPRDLLIFAGFIVLTVIGLVIYLLIQ